MFILFIIKKALTVRKTLNKGRISVRYKRGTLFREDRTLGCCATCILYSSQNAQLQQPGPHFAELNLPAALAKPSNTELTIVETRHFIGFTEQGCGSGSGRIQNVLHVPDPNNFENFEKL